MNSSAAALALLGGVAFALMALLGLFVRRGAWAIDPWAARVLFGHGVPAAIAFTRSGYARSIGVQLVILALLAFVFQRGLVEVAVLGLSQSSGQIAINHVLKPFFARARPEEFHYRRERSPAYPSGHAATGVVFYGGIALLAPYAFHGQPLAIETVRIAACLWGLGLIWSRVALGAHYATDVLGGLLFGLGWAAEALALSHFGGISV
ncbi:MAG: phosphatase PAP2 family protein [Candidatus Baltobacteraceae bacterium]